MAFVFDDPALVDLARDPHPPFARLTFLRNARGLTHFLNLCSIRLHGVKAAWPWHLENGLLHGFNAYLVGLLWGPWAAAAYFVHPVSGGHALYVSARADLLMVTCACLAVLSWEAYGIWAVFTPVCCWAARGAKGPGIAACGFLFFVRWLFP